MSNFVEKERVLGFGWIGFFVFFYEFFLLMVVMDESVLDDIIKRLVAAKNGRTTKQVQLTEAEIRQLCAASKEIFLSQPNLLELEAPIKICGIYGIKILILLAGFFVFGNF